MSVKVSARLSDESYKMVMQFEGKNFTEKLENLLSDKNNNLSDTFVCESLSDKNNNLSDIDILKYKNKINYLEYQLSNKISIFDEKYTYSMLGTFLFYTDFIQKFRNVYFQEFKDLDSFNALFDRLKIVYDESYIANQKNEVKLFGHVLSKDEYRAV